jgi:hypothetical protein
MVKGGYKVAYFKAKKYKTNEYFHPNLHGPGLNSHHPLNLRYHSTAEFCSPGKLDLLLGPDPLLS